jgi:uncharacterized protein with von Willebrand factor type A (vWA) domain
MTRSKNIEIDPLYEIRCIRDAYAKRFNTIEEFNAHLDKVLPPEEFLAKVASGEITEEDLRIPGLDDDVDPIAEIIQHRNELVNKYPNTEDFFNYLNTVPTTDKLLAELR